jgi:hypothetical protein
MAVGNFKIVPWLITLVLLKLLKLLPDITAGVLKGF